jgi:phosphoglycerate dehydrogenase-like enzyme
MTSSTIKVWLPTPEAAELMGGLPAGIAADVWTGGEQLPDSADEVEVVVLPFGVADAQMQGLAKLPRLRLIQLLSAGAERAIPFVPPGVTLANARGAHDPAVAEWIMAVILAQVRHLPKYIVAQQAGRWEHDAARPLGGQTILIVGYGSIGEATERMLAPMQVNVKRVAKTAREGVSSMDDLPSMLPNADIVLLLVPVTPATTKMVDEAFLARMKDGALLVNAARGSIVDTDALLKELTAGRLLAALDVTEPEPLPAGHPLWSAPGLLLTPHVGGATTDAMERALAIAKDQLARYAAGEPLLNVVGPQGY